VDASAACGCVLGVGCTDRSLRSTRSGGGPPLPWVATGGAGGAPNNCDGPHVLRLPRHLRGGVNALSREGCGHFEVFDQSDEGFKRRIFQVEDPVLKRSAGALFDRMWGPHGRETVRERSDRAMDQVKVHM
jgi:hypothetical protein